MPSSKKLLAFDLGAESGRGVLGLFDGNQLRLEVVHRFPNGGVRTLESWHWDVLRLFGEMLATLRRCQAEYGGIDALGVDTWGVDFALLGRGGMLLGNPRHYRDPHTEGAMELAFQRVPRAAVFRQTGIQFMRFNSLFQLVAMKRDGSPLLDVADRLLLMPDLFNFWFTGIAVNEFTNATTSQMYNPSTRGWAVDLVEALGLPAKLLGTVVDPGTNIGPLRSTILEEVGLPAIPVIAPATHDTGSAVAAVPAQGTSWAFISSGTWSLMGAELPAPLIDDATLRHNFTNEGGVDGTIRLLKNVMGLWLVQECRRTWERAGKPLGYDELAALASAAPPFASLVDPDDASFILPPSMPVALTDFCRRTGQPGPTEPGGFVRCALESLALKYRWVLTRLEELTGRHLEVIHVVGGGSQNEQLCQWTADACNRRVLAGPVEATAIGNVLVQAIGLRLLGSLADAREVVRGSFQPRVFEPRQPGNWAEPYRRFLALLPIS